MLTEEKKYKLATAVIKEIKIHQKYKEETKSL